MLILRSTPILAALSLLLSVLSAASSQVPDQLPPHAALPPAHSSLLANLDSSSSDSLKDLPQPLPFKIKHPRSLSTSEPTAISLERVQRNLGETVGEEGTTGGYREGAVHFEDCDGIDGWE